MRKYLTVAILLGALGVVPALSFAATPKHAAAAAAATHATRGIVKSIDASSLVITRSGKKHGEMTFVVNPSTHRSGDLAAGAPVSVRYRRDGKSYVATAIRVQHAKRQPARSS